jgi:hypothetical protein
MWLYARILCALRSEAVVAWPLRDRTVAVTAAARRTSRDQGIGRLDHDRHPEPMAEEQHNRHKFARDVAVNVVANLVAAAIIYILAVVGGYLRANNLILDWALFIIWVAAGSAVAVGLEELAHRRRWRWWSFERALVAHLIATGVFVFLVDIRLW